MDRDQAVIVLTTHAKLFWYLQRLDPDAVIALARKTIAIFRAKYPSTRARS